MQKQQQVLERLAALDARRKQEREKKRQELKDARNPNESTEEFLQEFSRRSGEVERHLAEMKGGREKVQKECDAQMTALSEMDDFVSQAAFYLPPFDVRQSRLTIADLRKKVDAVRAQWAPKKKFAFSKKTNTTKSETQSQETVQALEKPTQTTSDASTFAQASLEGKKDEQVRIGQETLGNRGFVVENCENCTIYLEGTPLALQLRNLEKCTVIVLGHVKGATMAFNLARCFIYLTSAQVRIHDSTETVFRLRVRSNPIIEHSTALQFGPIKIDQSADLLAPEDRAALLRACEALCEENDLWTAVHDFNWLRDDPSPNWKAVDDDSGGND